METERHSKTETRIKRERYTHITGRGREQSGTETQSERQTERWPERERDKEIKRAQLAIYRAR